jgi:UDP-3-O-[3-hydroxymyristoyl] glucosamine N-acyltransferase
MKLSNPITVKQIADFLSASFEGNAHTTAFGLNEIHKVEKGDIVFVDHPKYYDKTIQSEATIILIDKKVSCPKGKALVFCEKPFDDFNKLILNFSSFSASSSQIDPDAKIGKNTILQPGVFIGRNVSVGDNCIIHANVTINNNCKIGNNVIIHANTVIGGDAFYYQKKEGKYHKFNSCGTVVIGNDVEIGANCTIDRGVTGDTIIGNGTKIDNLVQIGHDTEVGENCLFASQVGIAGATKIKNNVTLWGQVGVISGIVIEENVTVLAQSGVGKSLAANHTYFGSPAEESKTKMREIIALKNLSNNSKSIR